MKSPYTSKSFDQSLKAAFWVFLSAFLLFAIVAPMGQVPSDTEYSIATAQAIVHHRTLALQKTDRLWALARTRTGQYHSNYGLGYAVSFIPQVIIADAALSIIHFNPDYVFEFVVSFTNSLYAAIIAALFFILFLRLGYRPRHALVCTALISCASILLPYSKIIHAEIPTTLCLMLFFLELTRKSILDLRKGVFLGTLVSALYLLKIGNLPLSCIVGSYALYCTMRRQYTARGLTAFCALGVLPMLVLLALNRNYYGEYFNFGYGTEQTKFTTPILTGLAGFFFSPSKSIFIFSPLLIACFLSAKRFAKRHPLVAGYALAIVVCDILFYSSWHDWHGGWCWGPRLIVPAVIIGHVFCIEFIDGIGKSVFKRTALVLLVFVSLWINMLGALVWYQQLYYFHKNFTSIQYSHPVIAQKLLAHKLQGKPEVYSCEYFGADCAGPGYHIYWNDIIKGNSIDFMSFEKFRGLATMWTGVAVNFGWNWVLIVPVVLFAFSLVCARRAFRLTCRN
jgi:hypothetical protein